jgi:inosine-uridine nucleoside N-ribohydrolase
LLVRGVSVTFGNVPVVRGYAAAQELLQRLDSGVLRAWHGASAPEERAAATEATALLEEALRKQSLTIVATGPATTIASVLLRHPELATRIERVILVAGTPVDANVSGASAIAKHDVNASADEQSMQVLLDSPLSLTLVRAGLGTGVGLDAGDLDRLDRGRGPIALITPAARSWLQATTGSDGAFAVPAMLAVDVAAHPGALRCEQAVAAMVSAPSLPRARPAARLGVAIRTTGRRVTWCHTADSGAKDRVIADVLRGGRQAR